LKLGHNPRTKNLVAGFSETHRKHPSLKAEHPSSLIDKEEYIQSAKNGSTNTKIYLVRQKYANEYPNIFAEFRRCTWQSGNGNLVKMVSQFDHPASNESKNGPLAYFPLYFLEIPL
jgi:hypothetical protein